MRPHRTGAVIAGLAALGLAATPARGQPPSSVPVTIGIEPGQGVSPDEVRAPAFHLDAEGRLVVIDPVRGFILGRFETAPGGGLSGGIELGPGGPAGPPLPPIPLTPLRMQTGFPFMAEGALAGSPCVADLDLDGRCETVIATTEGIVHLILHDGRVSGGWPQRVDDGFYAAPSAGDLDGDGDLEIVLGGISGRIYAWHSDGRAVRSWPVRPQPLPAAARTPGGIEFHAPAAVADVTGDGRAEICIAAQGAVWILNAAGRPLPGWPRPLPPATNPPNPASAFAPPALGDLDGDGEPELILATNAGRIHAWHINAQPVAGWPIEVPNRARAGFGGVALGDVDADGRTEVVVTSEHGAAGPATVAVFDGEGRLKPGWPYALPEPCNAGAALGDLDGDGLPEIVVATIGGNAAVVALDATTAKPLAGWPVRLKAETVNAGPLITDIDGDGYPDVVVAALSTSTEADAWIWAIDRAGHQIRDFPIMLPNDEIVRAAPVAADLDGDGDLELLAATERLNTLYVWDLDALCDPASMPWPSAAGSASRCACLETVEPALARRADGETAGGLAPGDAGAGSGGPISGLEPGVDPMDGPADGGVFTGRGTSVGFTLTRPAHVKLVIQDIRGAVIRGLLDHDLPPGEYRILWDGSDERGRPQPSGIYHFQLAAGDRVRTQQLLLIR